MGLTTDNLYDLIDWGGDNSNLDISKTYQSG